MKAAEIIMGMVVRLAEIAGRALAGREQDPARRVEEVWETNRSAMAKAQMDDHAEQLFGTGDES